MRGLPIRLFWNGIGEAHADPEWPEWLKKNTTDVYSIHLELRMAFICQISVGKWKYVNPCLGFLGIPDQRTAYVKRQVRSGWTHVRRSSVTPDLLILAVRVLLEKEARDDISFRGEVANTSFYFVSGFWISQIVVSHNTTRDSRRKYLTVGIRKFSIKIT